MAITNFKIGEDTYPIGINKENATKKNIAKNLFLFINPLTFHLDLNANYALIKNLQNYDKFVNLLYFILKIISQVISPKKFLSYGFKKVFVRHSYHVKREICFFDFDVH